MPENHSKIQKIHDMLFEKKISCKELTEKFLNIIDSENPKLNAYITVCKDLALETAENVDKKIAQKQNLLPLEGIPFALKDIFSTKNIRTTCASKMLNDYVPFFDATVWQILKNQNAVLLGKTNMDEFAMGSTGENSYFGGSHNPHNLNHVAGGSSSGSAVATSGNLSIFSLGTDTGGSIRQPAAFCGIVGIKPTYGAVSRYGVLPYASSFDTIGAFAQCSEDLSIVFDKIAQQDAKEATSINLKPNSKINLNSDIRGKKVAIVEEFFKNIGAETSSKIEDAIKIFEKMGCEVKQFNFSELEISLPVYYILVCAEAASNLAKYDGIRYGYVPNDYNDINEMILKSRSEGFGNAVKQRIMLGNYVLSSGYYDAFYKKATMVRRKIRDGFRKIFNKSDVIISPVSPITAPKLGNKFNDPVEEYMMDICTVPINTAGIPAVSVPCGFDSNGLPIGMQIIGKWCDDALLLNFAHKFEVYTNFAFEKELEMGVKL